ALNDALGGRLSMVIEGVAALAGPIESGALKAIATGSPDRLPNFPNLPAAAETLPGFNARGWGVLVAPLGNPHPIVSKVSEALRKAVADPELQKKVAVSGNYLRQMTPEQTLAYIQAEQQMWKPILEDIEAHPER